MNTWTIDLGLLGTLVSGGLFIFGIIKWIRDLNRDREKQRGEIYKAIYKTEEECSRIIEANETKHEDAINALEKKHDTEMALFKTHVEQIYVQDKYCRMVHTNSDASIARIENSIKGIWEELKALRKEQAK